MTLKELQVQVKKDCRIQGDQLNLESIRTPDIFHDYNKMLMLEKLALKDLEREWDREYLKQWEYYRKKSDPEVYEKKPLLKKIMDSDVKLYLNADETLQNLRTKIEGKEELIDFLTRTITLISSRQWLIKNAIDHNNYLQGQ